MADLTLPLVFVGVFASGVALGAIIVLLSTKSPAKSFKRLASKMKSESAGDTDNFTSPSWHGNNSL